MQTLEMRGELDRAVEFLPDEMTIAERRKRNAGLTRPELAVLLAYAKLSLYNDLLDSTVPDDPYLRRELGRYFPKEMSERYPEALQAHRLRREIITTQLTNSMINRGGATLTVRIANQTGAAPSAIAAAFAAVRNSYDLSPSTANRRARQQDFRQDPARSIRGGAGSAARPAGLVPAQCGSNARTGNDCRALPRGHRTG
jgi:glutamate dehydrogenase